MLLPSVVTDIPQHLEESSIVNASISKQAPDNDEMLEVEKLLNNFSSYPKVSSPKRSNRRKSRSTVAFAAIRTTKTQEHFAESSYTTQLRVQTMHNTRIVLPVASTIARAEICLGC